MTPTERLALAATMNATEILCRAPAEHTLALAAADRIAAARHAMDGEAATDHAALADMARQVERIAAAATAIRTELAAFTARLAHVEALAEAAGRLVADARDDRREIAIRSLAGEMCGAISPEVVEFLDAREYGLAVAALSAEIGGSQCADTDGLAAERDPVRAAAQDAPQGGWAVPECGETSTPVLVPLRPKPHPTTERRARAFCSKGE